MSHQELTQALRKQKVGCRRVPTNAEKNLVGSGEVGQRTRVTCGELSEARQSMCSLTGMEKRDRDVNNAVV